jgi:hypothetical protein
MAIRPYILNMDSGFHRNDGVFEVQDIFRMRSVSLQSPAFLCYSYLLLPDFLMQEEGRLKEMLRNFR